MFEQAFKRMNNSLHKDSASSAVMDRIEQISWILFLKYLNDQEEEKEKKAKLDGKKYKRIIKKEYQWEQWAAPKTKDGKPDHNKELIGGGLIDFVNKKLFPYLKSFSSSIDTPNKIEYNIREIFSTISNRISDGYILKEVINEMEKLKFNTKKEKHEITVLYEDGLQQMGTGAGKNGGEYYTPRPLIKTIVKVVNPKIGEKIYDGATGSAGFLVEAYDHILSSKLTVSELKKLKTKTLYGKEDKPLPFICGVMNMILHGIESPNIEHGNTLEENVSQYQEKDKVDVVLANPPFGGKGEKANIKQNFPIQNSSETSFLFLQHFIKKLKVGGRAGIIIKNTFLSNQDAAELRKYLLRDCEIETILELPQKVFTAGVKTIVLFFRKGKATKKIWYYQLNLDRNLGKTNPLNENDLSEFLKLQKSKKDSPNSWFVNAKDLDQKTFDMSVKNPNTIEDASLRSPQDILKEIKKIDDETKDILANIKKLI